MSDATTETDARATAGGIPPVATPERRPEPDPRARLHELAGQFVRTQNRRLLAEFLRLRRTVQG